MALPMPLLPPVMTATFSFRSITLSSYLKIQRALDGSTDFSSFRDRLQCPPWLPCVADNEEVPGHVLQLLGEHIIGLGSQGDNDCIHTSNGLLLTGLDVLCPIRKDLDNFSTGDDPHPLGPQSLDQETSP